MFCAAAHKNTSLLFAVICGLTVQVQVQRTHVERDRHRAAVTAHGAARPAARRFPEPLPLPPL